MSRSFKDMPKKVLADKGVDGWRWHIYHYDFETYQYPIKEGRWGLGKPNTPGKFFRRNYWRSQRLKARMALMDCDDPFDSRPRNDLKYMCS